MKLGADRKWMILGAVGVPVIGAVLAVIGTSALNMLKQERVRQTQSLLERTTHDLVRFQSDCGFYPSSEQGLRGLINPPSTPPLCSAWRGPYGVNGTQDAWGSPLRYVGGGQKFSLVSLGADRAVGGEGYDADLVFGGYE